MPALYEYGDCYYCKGNVEERYISREVWWKGKLYVFENVPAGECVQCGEKVIKPQTGKRIDVLLREQSEPRKTMQVPVYEYAS